LIRVLVVDDERQILRVLRAALQAAGYEVVTAADGREGLQQFQQQAPDLVITDLAMPVMDGVELVRTIRERSPVPVIVLSVRNTETMKVQALDEGADDYLTKPFSTPELLARIRVRLRNAAGVTNEPEALSLGDFVVDVGAHSTRVAGQEVHLTPKEFDLLLAFARKPDRVLTHRVLLREVWGGTAVDQPENLRVLVGSLRKKLESVSGKRYIESEPWVGYRFHPGGNEEVQPERL